MKKEKSILPKNHRQHADPKHAKEHGKKLVEPNVYLKTQRDHKKWYNIHEMGKMRGEPRIAPREEKKAKGIQKHSLRKEK